MGHNIIRPESNPPVRSPTPRQHHINTGYYYQLKDRKVVVVVVFFFFVRIRGRGGGVLTCFSKLDKWRRGERIKFESETIVSNLWHDGWFMS